MNNVIYIAGKMRGLEDLGREKFYEAEKILRAKGWKVLNPARLPDDLPGECYMPICLAMLREADSVAMLDNWRESAGAQIEYRYADEIGKAIYDMKWGTLFKRDKTRELPEGVSQ